MSRGVDTGRRDSGPKCDLSAGSGQRRAEPGRVAMRRGDIRGGAGEKWARQGQTKAKVMAKVKGNSSRGEIRTVLRINQRRGGMEGRVCSSIESQRRAGPSPSKIIVNPADRSQFIATSYPAIKEARPDLKVLIREASGIEPRAFARFGESCLRVCDVDLREPVMAPYDEAGSVG